MTWAKLDDGFPTHPKILPLSDRAFRAHVLGICYSAQHLTDGFVPRGYVDGRASKELVSSKLWEERDNGFRIHDFTQWNPSREEVLEERARKVAAGKAGAKARWKAPAIAAASALDSSRDNSRHSNRSGSATGSSMPPSRPVPSRPEPVLTPTQTPKTSDLATTSRRERDPVFLGLCEVEGSDYDELGKDERKAIAVALAKIRKATPNVDEKELLRRSEIYREVMPPDTMLTANALAKHWAKLARRPATRTGVRDRAAEIMREAAADARG
jgi:hypothetical protein